MPPAFNLSQDQTLQFNLCTRLHSTDVDQFTPPPNHPGLPERSGNAIPWPRAQRPKPPDPLLQCEYYLSILRVPEPPLNAPTGLPRLLSCPSGIRGRPEASPPQVPTLIGCSHC